MRLLKLIAIAGFFAAMLTPMTSEAGYLSCKGNRIVDQFGNTIRLTGVNWFGFETSNGAPHGLWSRDYRGMLKQIQQLGFNCLRIPWCNKILVSGAMPNGISTYGNDPFVTVGEGQLNAPLTGKTSLQVLDSIIAECTRLGLKVILDNHSHMPDNYISETLWYTPAFTEQQAIDDWVFMAKHYAGNSTIIGMDLKNEPHGHYGQNGSEWGSGNRDFDWRLAAERIGNAILAVNPDVLILVEGTEQADSGFYWWGGNLSAAGKAPVRLSNPAKLVYSPHEYGPEIFPQSWFSDPAFPANMDSVWTWAFGHLYKTNSAPLLVGEFGIRDTASMQGKAGIWFRKLLAYMARNISWTFWCINPNSGDTGGILKDDWVTVVDWKMEMLQPYLAPLVDEQTSIASRPSSRKLSNHSVSGTGPALIGYSINGKEMRLTNGEHKGGPGVYLLYDRQSGRAIKIANFSRVR